MTDLKQLDDEFKAWAKKMFKTVGTAFLTGLVAGLILGATVLYGTIQAILN